MKLGGICLALLTAASLGACGPSNRGSDDDIQADDGDDDDDDDDTPPDAYDCTPTASTEESCNDGFDEDCDTFTDCEDVDCLNHTDEGCPSNNCGELTHPESTPLALPDDGGTLETATPYETSIEVTGFAAGQTLNDVSGILGVCVTMEHTWIRDLQIEADAPNGTTVILDEFLGQEGGETYLGIPDESDGTGYGTGWEYCWTPTATNPPILEYCNDNNPSTLPAGDYQASGGFEPWVGTELNGNWTIRVYDLWAIDNGYIFDWTVKFDPNLVEDCSSWPTE